VKLEQPEGATPLDPELLEDLIPDITTQAQLNEFEQLNIAHALTWARLSATFRRALLTTRGLQALHRKMFDGTWKWAGSLRTRETNIGIRPRDIPVELRTLCDDTTCWIDNETFAWPELAVRFHHRLVSIHPFPNGNGRHARLAADLLLEFNGQPTLAWGDNSDLATASETRSRYIKALQAADRGDLNPLVAFATH